MQPDASGNNGGHMLNANGRIIGIVNAKVMAAGVEGLGFAIPTATVMERVKVVIDWAWELACERAAHSAVLIFFQLFYQLIAASILPYFAISAPPTH